MEESNQLELNIPRKRVRLAPEAGEASAAEKRAGVAGGVEVRGRFGMSSSDKAWLRGKDLEAVKASGAFSADRQAAENIAGEVNVEAFIGYTKWYLPHEGMPPCNGYWDMSFDPSGAKNPESVRLWYSAGEVTMPDGAVVPWESLRPLWRGLVGPHVDGYAYQVPSTEAVPAPAAKRQRVRLDS